MEKTICKLLVHYTCFDNCISIFWIIIALLAERDCIC